MNQEQRKYAIERVNGIRERKFGDALKRYTKEGKVLSDVEKVELVRSHKVSLKGEAYAYTDIKYAFDFSKFERDSKTDAVALDKAKAQIIAAANRIKDKIMLGDAEEALALIEAFDK